MEAECPFQFKGIPKVWDGEQGLVQAQAMAWTSKLQDVFLGKDFTKTTAVQNSE